MKQASPWYLPGTATSGIKRNARHCERSEATQKASPVASGLPRRLRLLAMTEKANSPLPIAPPDVR